MKRSTLGPWISVAIGALYFLLPLIEKLDEGLSIRQALHGFVESQGAPL